MKKVDNSACNSVVEALLFETKISLECHKNTLSAILILSCKVSRRSVLKGQRVKIK